MSHVLINTHHDVIDLVNHRIVKNTENSISWGWNMIFPWSRKISNLCLKWHILRKYCSIAEVTFKSDIFVSFDTLTPAPSFKSAFVAYLDRSNPTFPFPQEYSQGSVKYWLFLIVYLLYWFNYWMLLNHNSFIFRRVCHLFPLLLFQSWTLFIFSYATHFHKMYQQLTCKYGKVFFYSKNFFITIWSVAFC